MTPPPVERAFQLAQTGRFRDASEIERALKSEGVGSAGDLDGVTLRWQLKAICDKARGKVAKPASLAKASHA